MNSQHKALRAEIDKLPEHQRLGLLMAFDKVVDANKKRMRIMKLVQEALSQLRLDMKYLLFDLECTRKERDEARNAVGGDLQ